MGVGLAWPWCGDTGERQAEVNMKVTFAACVCSRAARVACDIGGGLMVYPFSVNHTLKECYAPVPDHYPFPPKTSVILHRKFPILHAAVFNAAAPSPAPPTSSPPMGGKLLSNMFLPPSRFAAILISSTADAAACRCLSHGFDGACIFPTGRIPYNYASVSTDPHLSKRGAGGGGPTSCLTTVFGISLTPGTDFPVVTASIIA